MDRRGNSGAPSKATPRRGRRAQGKVSSGDLPALFILKTILDLKIIEAGWWHDVATCASMPAKVRLCEIRTAMTDKRAQILDWIKDDRATDRARREVLRLGARSGDSPVRHRAPRSSGPDVGTRSQGAIHDLDNHHAAARPGCRADLLLGLASAVYDRTYVVDFQCKRAIITAPTDVFRQKSTENRNSNRRRHRRNIYRLRRHSRRQDRNVQELSTPHQPEDAIMKGIARLDESAH